MICYLIFSVLIAAAAFTVRRRSLLRLTGAAFYAVQAAFAVRIVAGGLYGETSAVWFAFDAAGTLFYCLLCIVSAFAFFHSKASLHDCDLRQTRTYAGLLMLLTTAIAGAYFASNLAVTWIFLEATTLCSAGIVYHRRTAQALEAAWKYVFVCSPSIARNSSPLAASPTTRHAAQRSSNPRRPLRKSEWSSTRMILYGSIIGGGVCGCGCGSAAQAPPAY